MRIQTLSIITGTKTCNARCPYCVAKMTPSQGIGFEKKEVNWRNFRLANRFAKDNGVSTVLITGKGEPTLFPDQISEFLKHLEEYRYPFIELQTNGLAIAQGYKKLEPYLKEWYNLGLTLIAISIAHYDPKKNKEIFTPHEKEYINLPDLIKKLHSLGFSIRLSCVLCKKYIDSVKELKKLAKFAKENKIEHLTLTPVEKPYKSDNKPVVNWVKKHKISKKTLKDVKKFLDKEGNILMQLPHGAIVYDFDGQNVCLSNCLTLDPNIEKIRQLIFFPDGHLRYDWQYKGALLI